MKNGLTLLELIIVLAIMSILVSLAVGGYSRWKAKVDLENDVSKIYAFLQNMRNIAFTERKNFDFVFNGTRICAECSDSGCDDIHCIRTRYEFTSNNAFGLTDKGIFTVGTTIRPVEDLNSSAGFDCLKVSITRVVMGKWSGSSCDERW